MALREIKTKIQSMQNTAKITKAMELVSSVKLRRFEELTVSATDYLDMMKDLITLASKSTPEPNSFLFGDQHKRPEKVLIFLIGSSKGLVGPMLHQLRNKLFDLIQDLKSQGIDYKLVSVKPKTLDILKELGLKPDLHFSGTFETASVAGITPLKQEMLNSYPEDCQAVYAVFMRYHSPFVQEAVAEKFVPLTKEEFKTENEIAEVPLVFEPSGAVILEHLTEDYLEAFLIYATLNSTSSENASRIITMKQANKNAKELEEVLTLRYNKQRQEQITSQIQESYLSSYSN